MTIKLIKKVKNYLFILPLLLNTSCATYKFPTSHYLAKNDEYGEIRKEALEHELYNFIPRHRKQIKWHDFGHWATWCLFGNDDDGVFGEDSRRPYSTNINSRTFTSWTFRNPGHNLTGYVIGSAHWKKHYNFSIFDFNNKDSKLLQKGNNRVFSGDNCGLKLEFNDYKPFLCVHFPVAKSKEFQSYFGWRPGGKFGIKLRPIAKKK